MRWTETQNGHRIGALLLGIAVALSVAKCGVSYGRIRLEVVTQQSEVERRVRELRQRRVDLDQLRERTRLLSKSEALRAWTIDAPNDRAALVKLQHKVRVAVEALDGKLLSAIERTGGQGRDEVRLLVRARAAERVLPQLLAEIESGVPRLRIDEAHLVSRTTRLGESTEIEATLTVRVRWAAYLDIP